VVEVGLILLGVVVGGAVAWVVVAAGARARQAVGEELRVQLQGSREEVGKLQADLRAAVAEQAAALARAEAAQRGLEEQKGLLEDAKGRLTDAFKALAAEALKQMAGDAFVVKLSAADRAALGDGLAADIARRVGRLPSSITISKDATIGDGGPIIQDAEGRQVWDNRLSVRLERFWPELRRQIALRTGLVAGGAPAGGGA